MKTSSMIIPIMAIAGFPITTDMLWKTDVVSQRHVLTSAFLGCAVLGGV
jgi:hypothetical protein